MRLCRRPPRELVASPTASCGSCASSPRLPSPCVVRLRRPTRALGVSRNERCQPLQGSGTLYRTWCGPRTWTETPWRSLLKACFSGPLASWHAVLPRRKAHGGSTRSRPVATVRPATPQWGPGVGGPSGRPASPHPAAGRPNQPDSCRDDLRHRRVS